MATLAGRIAEQGLRLLNEIAAKAWSLEGFASSGPGVETRMAAVMHLLAGSPRA